MENHKLVLPEHLNQHGYLFGGYLLQWVDECSWIAASLEYPGCSFVTVGMDKVEFRKSVRQGTILALRVDRVKAGNTSVQYAVKVTRDTGDTGGAGERDVVFTTNVTFVRVDDQGRKTPLPKLD